MTKDDWSEMTSCYRASTSVSTIVILLRPARIEALEQDVIASLGSAEPVADSTIRGQRSSTDRVACNCDTEPGRVPVSG
jgi:hypothetical protein